MDRMQEAKMNKSRAGGQSSDEKRWPSISAGELYKKKRQWTPEKQSVSNGPAN